MVAFLVLTISRPPHPTPVSAPPPRGSFWGRFLSGDDDVRWSLDVDLGRKETRGVGWVTPHLVGWGNHVGAPRRGAAHLLRGVHPLQVDVGCVGVLQACGMGGEVGWERWGGRRRGMGGDEGWEERWGGRRGGTGGEVGWIPEER